LKGGSILVSNKEWAVATKVTDPLAQFDSDVGNIVTFKKFHCT